MRRPRPKLRSCGVVVTAVLSSLGLLAVSPAPASGAANSFPRTVVGAFATPTGGGFLLAFSNGVVEPFGDARFVGDAQDLPLQGPVQGGSAVNTGGGYWLVASDGGIFTFGDAPFAGSAGSIHLNKPIVGVAVGPAP